MSETENRALAALMNEERPWTCERCRQFCDTAPARVEVPYFLAAAVQHFAEHLGRAPVERAWTDEEVTRVHEEAKRLETLFGPQEEESPALEWARYIRNHGDILLKESWDKLESLILAERQQHRALQQNVFTLARTNDELSEERDGLRERLKGMVEFVESITEQFVESVAEHCNPDAWRRIINLGVAQRAKLEEK